MSLPQRITELAALAFAVGVWLIAYCILCPAGAAPAREVIEADATVREITNIVIIYATALSGLIAVLIAAAAFRSLRNRLNGGR